MSDSQTTVPYGYCQCGCGEKTKVAAKSRTDRGYVRGEPIRYVRGHQHRHPQPWYLEEDTGFNSPCWIWRGHINGATKYGVIWREGKARLAHRWVYQREVGAIPMGMVLDHLCRVPACVNPEHLEPVTNAENVLRGFGPFAVNARKTHCPRGHEYTPDNTYITKQGFRNCRSCSREKAAERRERKKKGNGEDLSTSG